MAWDMGALHMRGAQWKGRYERVGVKNKKTTKDILSTPIWRRTKSVYGGN